MVEAFSSPRKRIWAFAFLGVCLLSAIAAAVVGISDNPSGILLAFVSAIAFILAFVHPWRTSKAFRYLLYASALGSIVLVVLHAGFEYVALKYAVSGLFHHVFQVLNVACFLIAIVLCPPGIVVGGVGAFVMALRNWHRSTDDKGRTKDGIER